MAGQELSFGFLLLLLGISTCAAPFHGVNRGFSTKKKNPAGVQHNTDSPVRMYACPVVSTSHMATSALKTQRSRTVRLLRLHFAQKAQSEHARPRGLSVAEFLQLTQVSSALTRTDQDMTVCLRGMKNDRETLSAALLYIARIGQHCPAHDRVWLAHGELVLKWLAHGE